MRYLLGAVFLFSILQVSTDAFAGGGNDMFTLEELGEASQSPSPPYSPSQGLLEVPSGCNECMSACPHDSREILECDRGCPVSCSHAQAHTWKAKKQAVNRVEECYSCMSECPHVTKDLKACDRGCPKSCDAKSLRGALVKANAINAHCQIPVDPVIDHGNPNVR